MKHVVAVRKWGNSRAVVIPKDLQKQLSWRVGQVMYVTVETNKLVFRPVEVRVGNRVLADGGANAATP